jgi:outer membrane protein assembly factor BamD
MIRTSNNPKKMLQAANDLYEEGDYYKAITLYELIIPSFRGQAEAEQIAYNYAYAHYNQKKYISASHYFNQFSKTFGNSDKKEEADFMSAFANTRMSPTHKLDQTFSEKAIEGLQVFVNNYPESPKVAECNDLIDGIRSKMERKSYESAKLYYKLKSYSSSVVAFENMLKDYPETDKEEEIRYLIAKSSFDLAQNSVYEKKEERFLATVEKCNLYLKKFPEGEKNSEITTFINKSNKELEKFNNG